MGLEHLYASNTTRRARAPHAHAHALSHTRTHTHTHTHTHAHTLTHSLTHTSLRFAHARPIALRLLRLSDAWFIGGGSDSESCPNGLLVPGPVVAPASTLYTLSVLFWLFYGVSIGADIFMEAIETITSSETTTIVALPGGQRRPLTVRVWNGTVANLTLMALGSSAPEILLSVIEICGNSFYSGELGPSTIVGSAAFNLMVRMPYT